MILGWLRLAFFLLVGQSLVFFLLRIYLRSLRRESLEERWARQGRLDGREAFIEADLRLYDRRIHFWLLWLVYILPMLAFSVIFFATNNN